MKPSVRVIAMPECEPGKWYLISHRWDGERLMVSVNGSEWVEVPTQPERPEHEG